MPKPPIRVPTALALASMLAISLLTACADQSTSRFAAQCSDGGAVHDPENNPDLVSDCATLLVIKDALDESDSLNWSPDRSIRYWDGVATENNRVSLLILGGLSGEIPPELGNLANLRELYIAGNDLTGAIPSELGNLSNLATLSLSGNQLTGKIPPELGNLSNLALLSLDGNQLTGEIPPKLGNLSNLDRLSLGDNQLTRCIPASLRARFGHDGIVFGVVGLPIC